MIVRLKPDTVDSGNYQIQVWQHDLDGDRPMYVRNIVLNGSAQASEQMFWMYFLPQPINNGLSDQNLHELQKDLQVFLYSGDGKKQIAKLPLTSTLQNVDPSRNSMSNHLRGSKLILSVSATGAKQPPLGKYNDAYGSQEDIEMVNLRLRDLPEDPIGYESVDGIIWMDGDPSDLSSGNQDTLAALKDYIRFGGQLIICQSTDNWQQDLSWGDMLPVDLEGVASKSDYEPLKSMAAGKNTDPFQSVDESWGKAVGPFPMARAKARPGSVVQTWIDWKQDGSYIDATPYLARKAYGSGQVTWVAQNLSVDTLPTNPTGWPHVWDKVFGWKSSAYILPGNQSPDDDRIKDRLVRYHNAGPVDLGYKMVQGLNLDSKSAWLIFLAVMFFLIYWLIAGPVSYGYLVAKKKQGLSWFFFGASALVATGVTVLMVHLVLRGAPVLAHLSFVRMADGQPAIVYSRFGLYIPNDGDQKIELQDTSGASVSCLSPFAEHPQQLGDVSEFPSPADYMVPVRDLKSDTLPQLTVPYRSSMKKFQARWVGDVPAKFVGSVKLDRNDKGLPLSGSITNATGQDLTDVYMAFNVENDRDWMIYVPTWNKGLTYNLKKDFGRPKLVGKEEGQSESIPGKGVILCDEIAPNSSESDTQLHGWQNFWFNHFRRSSMIDDPNVNDSDFGFVYPVASLFTRLPAMPDTINGTKGAEDRVELYNRGLRMINASPSVTAGQLVILTATRGPLPIPLQVNGDKIDGDGTVFYQFILPINRGKVEAPTTMPAK